MSEALELLVLALSLIMRVRSMELNIEMQGVFIHIFSGK